MSAIRLLALRDTPLDLAEVLAAVADPAAGGVVSFPGLVRAHDGGKGGRELEYVAHPNAEAALRSVAEAVAADLPVHGLAAVHRTGCSPSVTSRSSWRPPPRTGGRRSRRPGGSSTT